MAVADVLLARSHTCQTSLPDTAVKPPFMASKFVPEPWLPAQAKDDSRPSTSSSFVTARPNSPKHDLLDVEHDIGPTLEHEHPSPPPSVVSVEPDWLSRLDELPTSLPASTSATTDRLTTRHASEKVASPPQSSAHSSHAPEWIPSRSNGTAAHVDEPSPTSPDKWAPSAPNTQNRDQNVIPSTNGAPAIPASLRPGYKSVKASAPLPADNMGARRAEAPRSSSIALSISNGGIHRPPRGSISTSDSHTGDDLELSNPASAPYTDNPSSAAKSSAHTSTHAPTSSASSLQPFCTAPPTHETYQLHESPGQMPAPLATSVEEKNDAGSPATQPAQPPADASSPPQPDDLTPAKSKSEPIAIPNITPLPVSALPAHIRPSTSAGPSPISPVPRASSLAPRPVSSAGPPSSSPRAPARTATTPRLNGLPSSPRFTFSGGSARLSPAILPRPSAQSIFPLPSIPKTPSSAPPPLSPERQRTQSLRHMPSLLRQGAATEEDDIATHDNAMLDGLEEDDEDGEVETEGEMMTDSGAGSGDGQGSDDGEDLPEQQAPDRPGRKGLTLRMPALKSPLSIPTAPGKSPFGFSFDRKADKERARERERESDGDKTPVPIRGFVDYFSSKPPEQEPMTPKTPRLSLSIKTPGLGMGAKTPGITSPKKSGAKTPGIPSATLGNGMTTPTQTNPPSAVPSSSPPPPPQWVPLAPPTPASPGARADIWANSLLSSGHSEHASKISRQQGRVVPMPEGDEGLSASPRARPNFYHQPSRSMVDMTAVARARVEPATPASPARPAPASEAPTQTGDGLLGPNLKRQRSLPTFGPHADPPPYPTFARGGPLPAPREDEGRERLPGYRNDIYLAGVLPRKMEFTAPGVQAKDRKWRRVLCVLEGTAFKIYALPIGKGGGSVLGGLWEKAVGAGDIAESPARASEVAAQTAQKRRERELEREREREALANKAEGRSSVDDTGAGSSSSAAGSSGTESPGGRSTSRLLGSSFLRSHRGSTSSRTSLSSANTADRSRASMDELGGRSSSNMRRLSVGASATSSTRTSFSNTRSSPPGSAGTSGASRILPASSSSSIAGSSPSIAPSGTSSSVSSVTHIRRRTGPEPAPSSPSTSSPGPATDPTRPLFHEPAKDVPRPEEGTLIREYSLQNAESGLASDYIKRRNVIRLRMEGEQFLVQASDVGSVVDWIEGFQAAANISLDLDERPMPRGPLFPRRRRRRAAVRPTEAEANPPPTMPSA